MNYWVLRPRVVLRGVGGPTAGLLGRQGFGGDQGVPSGENPGGLAVIQDVPLSEQNVGRPLTLSSVLHVLPVTLVLDTFLGRTWDFR